MMVFTDPARRHSPDWMERTHAVLGPGPGLRFAGRSLLSIKACFGGEMLYRVGRSERRIGPAGFIVVNDGQHYSVTAESDPALIRAHLFFSREMAADVAACLDVEDGRLLDNPRDARVPEFGNQVRPHGTGVTDLLSGLVTAGRHGASDSLWFEEVARRVLARLIRTEQAWRQVHASGTRPAVRAELARRVLRARDWIEADIARPVTLDALAAIAGLSPNHLIRAFRTILGQTPHRYLTERRLEAAQTLLARGSSVTNTCMAVGFESVPSFSRLFRQHTGLSPAAWRAACR